MSQLRDLIDALVARSPAAAQALAVRDDTLLAAMLNSKLQGRTRPRVFVESRELLAAATDTLVNGLTADQRRRFDWAMAAGGCDLSNADSAALCAVLGVPVTHTISPATEYELGTITHREVGDALNEP
jgi:hypothetical protein